MNNMQKDIRAIFYQRLRNLVDRFDDNVIEWSISQLNDKTNRYKYNFTVFNSAFRDEGLTFSFPYFRPLEEREVVKFIMNSLTSHGANYTWNNKKNQFIKDMICY